MATFQELSEQRHQLQDFCRLHYKSVEQFNVGVSFLNFLGPEKPQDKTDEVAHLTSSATCFASLMECPDLSEFPDSKELLANVEPFVAGAISKPLKEWKSDGAARIYCRCRALPFVTKKLKAWDPKIAQHVRSIFAQMDKTGRFAIGEADPKLAQAKWYPPNGYHTYWTLELLSVLSENKIFRQEYLLLSQKLKLVDKRNKMCQWAREMLGYQTALHSAKSSMLDSDQLGWSLAIVLRSPDALQSNLAMQDLMRHALKCLFDTQTNVGSWRHYGPLFHYPNSGNAYCYVFETFAEILRYALQPRAEFLRSILKTHFSGLIGLWQYARSTHIPLDDQLKPQAIGWSSGHRTDQRAPESWATASVFLYAQHLTGC